MKDGKEVMELKSSEMSLVKLTDNMLLDARAELNNQNAMVIPFAELATLGAGVSKIMPTLSKVIPSNNHVQLFKLVNQGIGDTLKVAKNGDFWGNFNTLDGKGKFARFQKASLELDKIHLDPSTIYIAAAMLAIEKAISNIIEIEKEILTFLEVEKEAEIEADVETLTSIVTKYKNNWDNKCFVTNNHKLVLDIQRNSRKNINFYKKEIVIMLKKKKFMVDSNMVKSKLNDSLKKFKYYRLSLFTYTLSSLMEIMLSENYQEGYMIDIENQLKQMSDEYRNLFSECSINIENISKSSVNINVVKGLGVASKTMGKFIGNIPYVKEGSIDEFLQDKGNSLKELSINKENSFVKEFATLNNPETAMIIEKINEINLIHNHTSNIYMDHKNLYLTL